jgi:uncharacterized protein (TIGR00255 family)
MKSMTGFGRGEASDGALRCRVELSSVNRKQGDIEVRLPREHSGLEAEIRRRAAGVLSRGRLAVAVVVERMGGTGAELRVDRGLAAQYAAALMELDREHFGGMGRVGAEALLRAPGVFVVSEQVSGSAEAVAVLVMASFEKALLDWDRAREREGRHLRRDLETRLGVVAKLAKGIRREAPAVPKAYREGLMKRLGEAGLTVDLADERLVREVALFADRCDISEELSRLGGHLEEFRRLCRAAEPAGRAMDFLCQELHRELNTIGSKAGHLGIAHAVVAGKTEVERIREQVQNAE